MELVIAASSLLGFTILVATTLLTMHRTLLSPLQKNLAANTKALDHLTENIQITAMESREDMVALASSAAVVVLRDGMMIATANRSAELLFGWPPGGLANRSLEVLIPTELREVHNHHWKRFWERPSARPMGTGLQLQGVRQDGSRLELEISLRPSRVTESVIATIHSTEVAIFEDRRAPRN